MSNGPYAQAARTYRECGWDGVIPVVGKHPPPTGWTGRNGAWPDDARVTQWMQQRGHDNLGLRVPDGVLGIDVDAYDGRAGAETIAEWEHRHGPLPPTWYSSSRDDGSGIYLFRVPQGLHWVSDLGRDSDVQIVRRSHRYAVVWPSIHPDTNRTYTWFTPDRVASVRPPSPDQLEELPEAWVDALRKGRTRDANDAGGNGDGGRSAGGHAAEDAEARDYDGNRVDPHRVLLEGLPVGEQETGLFSYLCSLRARGAHRDEMIVLGLAALQHLENATGREPWTHEDIIEKVDHVRREYAPGTSSVGGELPAEFREWAGRMAAAQRGDDVSQLEISERPPREPFMTDMGNSLRFAQIHRDRARYAADEGRWYLWDGVRWAPDTTDEVMELTKDVIDNIRLEATGMERDIQERWGRWARDSEMISKRRGMIAGAQSERGMVVKADRFDRDPMLLVVRNGTVDLRTGKLRESRQEDMNSRQAAVTFDADAECPRWKSHIRFISKGHEDVARYLWRAAGYTLTGSTAERAFFFLEGSGSNGKNAFIEPIMHVMGSYAQAGTSSMLTGGDEQHPTILADLLGARLVFVDETRQGRALNVERVKALTGSKRIKARRMREDFFEFDGRFKLWIAGNGRPTVRDPSDGVWKRMHRVLCMGKVGEDVELIRDFGELLYEEEAPGILNWLLQGTLSWLAEDALNPPASIGAAVEEYRDEEDFVGQFLDEFFVVTKDPMHVVTNTMLYTTYRTWAEGAGFRGPDMLNKVAFGKQLGARGLEKFHGRLDDGTSKMHRGYQGLRWKGEEDG